MIGDGPRRRDARSRWERGLRRAWEEGPGPALRLVAGVFGLGAALRNAAWEVGILRPARASVPVVSVGGLTVGGSGKTPLAAELARRMSAGRTVGVVTHGFEDEIRLHRELNPAAVVAGGGERVEAVEAAARAGADVAVVDGGFQHRRLWRDADVVALSARSRTSRAHRLPAGPYREGWSALGRADAVVVVRRTGPEEGARRLALWLEAALPEAAVARCVLRPAGLRPANDAARAAAGPDPAVAVASIMYPDVFLDQLQDAGRRPGLEFVFPDHAEIDGSAARRVAEAAGDGGIVGTLKDVVKLRSTLPRRVPLWYLHERLRWEEGDGALLERMEQLVRPPPATGGGPEERRARRGTGP